MKLNEKNLMSLSRDVEKPIYDRHALTASIIHIGVGGFHRSHQAYYLNELLNRGLTDWAICGMGIRKADEKIYKVMKEQDCLFTVVEKYGNGKTLPRIVGSITDFIFVPEDPTLAIDRLADPQTKIVSLTITEGGYNFDEEGRFVFDTPDIQWDMQHPEAPTTVFGLMATALRTRMQKGIPPFTVLSCDNIQHNGDVTKNMLLSFTDATDQLLSYWIRRNVQFPNCMVDRITPVTTMKDISYLEDQYGIEDGSPVSCEPFIQWVMENRFSNGRPTWENVGVQFVEDIVPYEQMKLRLLNAGHSLLGMTGLLYGCATISEAVSVPDLQKLLRQFMDFEASPVLGHIENIDLCSYKDTLVERFSNAHINDQLSRICGESSAKLPKFLIPTIQEQLAIEGPITVGALVLAAWCRILETYIELTERYTFPDAMLAELITRARQSAAGDELQFIRLKSVFGNLADNERFVTTYLQHINHIRQHGIRLTVQRLLE